MAEPYWISYMFSIHCASPQRSANTSLASNKSWKGLGPPSIQAEVITKSISEISHPTWLLAVRAPTLEIIPNLEGRTIPDEIWCQIYRHVYYRHKAGVKGDKPLSRPSEPEP